MSNSNRTTSRFADELEALRAQNKELRWRLARCGEAEVEDKRPERAKRDREAKLNALLANVDAIILEGDPFNIYYVGGRVEEILGYPNERWFEHPDGPVGFWSSILHHDDLGKIEICREAITRVEDHSFEYRLMAADGKPIWFYDTITVESKNGKPVKTRCVMIDITERKQAEEALRKSEQRYRAVVEDQTDFIVRWLPNGIRTFANQAYCDYFDQPLEQVIGSSLFPLIAKEDQDIVRRRVEALSFENPVSSGEHQVLRQDGTVSWNEWVDRAIFDKRGQLIEYQSVGRDITDRKRAEQRTREALAATARMSLLSNREREVMNLVVVGTTNKVIAQQLHITERTVEKHRANVMRKLHASSAAELVRIALIAEQSSGLL